MTPQQMRELADKHWLPIPHEEEVAVALRTAADQLEAVQGIADSHRTNVHTAACVVSLRLDRILTADIAPQEDDHV